MTLTASPNQTLTAYDESDWANDPDGFISVTGCLILLRPKSHFMDCKETETCYTIVNRSWIYCFIMSETRGVLGKFSHQRKKLKLAFTLVNTFLLVFQKILTKIPLCTNWPMEFNLNLKLVPFNLNFNTLDQSMQYDDCRIHEKVSLTDPA